MSRAQFLKGTQGKLDGREFTFLRQVDTGVWQIEDNATGELRRVPQKELLDRYLAGGFRFINAPDACRPANKGKRKERASEQFNLLPEILRDRAKHRRTYVEALLTEFGPTPTRTAAEAIIKKTWEKLRWPETPPHYVTVWRWLKRYLAAGNDVRSIVDCHHLCGNRDSRLPGKLVDIMVDSIDKIYLTEERNTIQDTLDYAITEVGRENLLRVTADQLPMPRLRQVKRLIDRIPAFDRYAARHGRLAAERYFRSVRKTPGTSFALERVEIDHTRLDLFVVDEEVMLPLGRPWLTLCIDVHTRCVLGFDLSFDPPSHLTVGRCLRHALLPKGDLKIPFPTVEGTWDMHGIMEMLVCDNGAEFHGDSLEMACLTLGINIQYCPRKQPWFKGSIERFLGTLNRGVAHGFPGTTFSSILEKEDYETASKATVTLSTLREIIHLWIVDYYHQRPHKTLRDTPAHAWRICTAGMDIPIPSDPEELKAVLGRVETRVLTHHGIEINNLFYNSTDARDVSRRLGAKLSVSVRYQDDDLGNIHILVPDTNEFLRIPAIDQEYARSLTLWQHRICRRFAKRQLNGRTDAVALAEAKRRIIELVEEDFGRKRRKSRSRNGRFLQNHPSRQSEVIPPSPQSPADPFNAEPPANSAPLALGGHPTTATVTPRKFDTIVRPQATSISNQPTTGSNNHD